MNTFFQNILAVAAAIGLAACTSTPVSPTTTNDAQPIPTDSTIVLLAPDTAACTSPSLMQALAMRRSIATDETFAERMPSLQQLSDLLWAANGFNRETLRTAPSAINAQDIDIYVCMPQGAYLYVPQSHTLSRVTTEDVRPLVAGFQEKFKDAPISLVLVSETSRFSIEDPAARNNMAHCDAAYVSANIGLYCAAAGLQTRPRMSADWEALGLALGFSPTQIGMLNNPVGYLE